MASAELSYKSVSHVIEMKILFISAFQQQGHLGEPACSWQAPGSLGLSHSISISHKAVFAS